MLDTSEAAAGPWEGSVWETRQIAGAGIGCVALRAIGKGERVLHEAPLLQSLSVALLEARFPADPSAQEAFVLAELAVAAAGTDAWKRDAVWALHDAYVAGGDGGGDGGCGGGGEGECEGAVAAAAVAAAAAAAAAVTVATVAVVATAAVAVAVAAEAGPAFGISSSSSSSSGGGGGGGGGLGEPAGAAPPRSDGGGGGKSVVGILDSNAFETDAGVRALFQHGSRFNHSCQPNVLRTWIGEGTAGRLVFHALRDVAAGEELSHDYCWEHVGGAPTRGARRAALQRWMRFACACACCRLPPGVAREESEARRARIQALRRAVGVWGGCAHNPLLAQTAAEGGGAGGDVEEGGEEGEEEEEEEEEEECGAGGAEDGLPPQWECEHECGFCGANYGVVATHEAGCAAQPCAQLAARAGLGHVAELLSLLDAELDGNASFKADAHYEGYGMALVAGEWTAARAHVRAAYEMALLASGADSDFYEEGGAELAEPTIARFQAAAEAKVAAEAAVAAAAAAAAAMVAAAAVAAVAVAVPDTPPPGTVTCDCASS
jgi:hypothetical protein